MPSKDGDWPHLQRLDIELNDFTDDPLGAITGLLHLTELFFINLEDCKLTGEAVSQIKPGDWSGLQRLNMSGNDFSDDPVGAMKGLLCLTSLKYLLLEYSGLTGEAVSQIKPGDWLRIRTLYINNNLLEDDPVGAMKGLLHLSSLTRLMLAGCRLNGVAFSQIKHGDWPDLEELEFIDYDSGERIRVEDYSDDPLGAINGLTNLPDNLLMYTDVSVSISELRIFIENNGDELSGSDSE